MIGFHDDRVHGGADDRVHGGADESRGCRGAFRGVELAEKFGHRIYPAKDPAKDIQGPRPVSGFPSLNILALIRGVA